MFRNLAGIFLSLIGFAAAADDINLLSISAFGSGKLHGWMNKEFEGRTIYRIVPLEGKRALKAESSASASGLIKEQRIDLRQTPYLNWSWRIENRLEHLNELEKSGDDYAARIYIVIDGGWAFWNTKAVNYVWSGASAKGKIWPNAFAGKNVMMLAVRTAEDPTSTWFQEKRNIRQDLLKIFGRDFCCIDAVALMTDTDNTRGKATAYYGDIYFSRD